MIKILVELGEVEEAFAWAQKSKGRLLLESVRKHLRSGGDVSPSNLMVQASRDQVRKALQSQHWRVGLLELYVSAGKVFFFGIGPDTQKMTIQEVACDEDLLRRLTAAYHAEIICYPLMGLGANGFTELFACFSKPFEMFRDCDVVCIVPHYLFHDIPFHALCSGEQWLIRKMAFAYLPCAGLLRRDSATEHAETGAYRSDRKRLVIGNARDVQGRVTLTHAEEEACAVGAQLGVKPLLGLDASKARLLRGLEEAEIVHVACHGFFDPAAPLESGLVMADGEVVTAAEILRLKLNADLVVLSCCWSDLASRLRTDEPLGLQRALLAAGASSVILGKWAVSDSSACALFKSFYPDWLSGFPKAVALQKAQAKFLGDPDRKSSANEVLGHGHEHPYFWAPFFLSGHWR